LSIEIDIAIYKATNSGCSAAKGTTVAGAGLSEQVPVE
jgi:hypothetical protein